MNSRTSGEASSTITAGSGNDTITDRGGNERVHLRFVPAAVLTAPGSDPLATSAIVPFTTLALGGSIKVPTLDGEDPALLDDYLENPEAVPSEWRALFENAVSAWTPIPTTFQDAISFTLLVLALCITALEVGALLGLRLPARVDVRPGVVGDLVAGASGSSTVGWAAGTRGSIGRLLFGSAQ